MFYGWSSDHKIITILGTQFSVTVSYRQLSVYPDSKVHGANMGPIWGRQDPGGSHVGPMDFAICVCIWVLWFLVPGFIPAKWNSFSGEFG